MPSACRRGKLGNHKALQHVAAALATWAVMAGPAAWAQPKPPAAARTSAPATQAARSADLLVSASRPLFAAAAVRAEEEVVPLVLQRADRSGDARQRLEAQIDLLIIERWIAVLPNDNETQAAAAWLRLQQVRQAAAAVRPLLSPDADQPLEKVQQLAIRNLHQLTPDLPESTDVAKMDTLSRTLGIALWELGTSQAASPAHTPAMRPTNLPVLPSDTPAAARPHMAAAGSTDPADLIPRLNVSPLLRQQLVRTLDAVQRPEVYEMTAEEARQLSKMLKEAIDISAGLASNAGVDLNKRMELERQLGEALALLQDRRLREIGQRKIEAMGRYRQVLSAIIRLNLSEQNYKLLAPAFQLAERSPEEAKRLIPAVEKFVAFCSSYDSLPASIQYNADPASVRAMQKAYEDSRKSFETARSGFLGDVETLGGNGISATSAADLEGRLEEMQLSMDVIQAMGAMPAGLDTLNAFKPKTPGGLERRIAKEAAIAASPGKGPVRKDAAVVLMRLVRLASTCRELQAVEIEGPALQVLQGYSKKSPEDLAAKWRANAAEVVNAAASNGIVDDAKIERNELLLMMFQTLPRLVAMEAALQPAGALQRWADWGLDERAVGQALYSIRAAAAAAFTAFLSDDGDGMRNWGKVQQEQQPVANFLARSIAGATQIPTLKGDLETACAKLMTPLDAQAFSLQRRYGLAMTCLSRPDLDPRTAADLRAMLARALAQFR